MKHEVNAMGKQCPIPVVMTKKVIDNAAVGDEIEILIDNETAVNNLSRLANKTGCTFVSEKLGDKKYQVKMAVKTEQTGGTLEEEEFVCEAPHKKVPFLRWKHIQIQSFSIMEVQNLQQKTLKVWKI